jgi:hypothetical protein
MVMDQPTFHKSIIKARRIELTEKSQIKKMSKSMIQVQKAFIIVSSSADRQSRETEIASSGVMFYTLIISIS